MSLALSPRRHGKPVSRIESATVVATGLMMVTAAFLVLFGLGAWLTSDAAAVVKVFSP